MRERLAEMYKVICRIERKSMSNPEAVLHFSVMDINKRGGGSDMKKGTQVREYCRYYADFIRAEIDIISPDVVAIIGRKLYDLNLHVDYLDAINEGGKCYFLIKDKKVPILSLYQTCFFQGRGEPLSGYGDNLTVGRQAKRCLNEMRFFYFRGIISTSDSVFHTKKQNYVWNGNWYSVKLKSSVLTQHRE